MRRSSLFAFATAALVACAGPSHGTEQQAAADQLRRQRRQRLDRQRRLDGQRRLDRHRRQRRRRRQAAPRRRRRAMAAPPPSRLGCNAYVQCLAAAMSDADATACDNAASDNAKNILDAVDTCVGNYCLGMTGGDRALQSGARPTARSRTSTARPRSTPPPARPPATAAPASTTARRACSDEACMPTNDAACNTAACAQQTAACHADK